MGRSAAVGLVLLLAGTACRATQAPPTSDFVTVTLNHPAGHGAAVITTLRFSAAEIASNTHREPAGLYTWLERVERQTDLDPGEERIALRVPAGQAGDVLRVLVDTGGAGLDGLFGAPGVADVLIELPPSGEVTRSITFRAPVQREACAGPRLVRFELDAPEVVHGTDPGRHVACVQLPASYEAAPTRRYPVVLVFPGFSGRAAENDGFSARQLFDSLGAEAGVEVLLVGVETRTFEGTRYLSTGALGGDWLAYVTKRLVPELDRRFRTQARRAAFGHSTGGWNALSLALAHPEFLEASAASSPDPLDLDVWLQHKRARQRWASWQRAEERLQGRGQFHSWATSWSPDGRLLFDEGGEVRPDVLAAWKRQSPAARLASASPRLSGRLFLTAGTKDMFGLYEPTFRFVEGARAGGLAVTWVPTELDHFGATEARFTPLVRFLLEQLRGP
jgi:pimeloyl-ACP methyl ester carboxylesterase